MNYAKRLIATLALAAGLSSPLYDQTSALSRENSVYSLVKSYADKTITVNLTPCQDNICSITSYVKVTQPSTTVKDRFLAYAYNDAHGNIVRKDLMEESKTMNSSGTVLLYWLIRDYGLNGMQPPQSQATAKQEDFYYSTQNGAIYPTLQSNYRAILDQQWASELDTVVRSGKLNQRNNIPW